MKTPYLRSAAVALAALLLGAGSAQATVVVNAQEESGDVVITFSGTIALNSLPPPDVTDHLTFGSSAISILPANINFAFEPPGTHVDEFTLGVSGSLPPFGLLGGLVTADSSTGDYFYFATDGASATLALPHLYAGESLAGSMTFDHATFSSLGILPGSFAWSWSNGNFSDEVTFDAARSVPDATPTLGLLGGAFAALVLARRRFAR